VQNAEYVAVIELLCAAQALDLFTNMKPGEGTLAAYKAIRRGGLAVVVGVAKPGDTTAVRTMTLPFEEKTLTGSYFGSCVPRIDFPRMLALYAAGKLKLDELITRRYRIEEAPQAFADMQSGRNARGVIVFQ